MVLRLEGHSGEVMDLSNLQLLPQLEHLRLGGDKLEITSPFTLPLLHTLSVTHSTFAAIKTLLDPVYLPSLRNLALPDVDLSTGDALIAHQTIYAKASNGRSSTATAGISKASAHPRLFYNTYES
ncbi:hypothetical protein JCM5353_007315 [Sporobolomyces roseus]